MQKNHNKGQNSISIKDYVNENLKKAEVDFVNKTIQEGFDNNNSKPFWHYVKTNVRIMLVLLPWKLGVLHGERKNKAQIPVEEFYSVLYKKLKIKFYQFYQNSLSLNYPNLPLQCLELKNSSKK